MEWISVKDRVPEFSTEVLIIEEDYISIGEYCDYSNILEKNGWIQRDAGTCNPTHWMPLPLPPEDITIFIPENAAKLIGIE